MARWNQKRADEVGNDGVVAAMVVAVARARWWGVVREVEDGMVIWCGRGWPAESEGDPWWRWRGRGGVRSAGWNGDLVRERVANGK